MSLNKPMYSKPAYVKVKTKTQLRKELAQLRKDLKAGLKGPDADLYKILLDSITNVKII